jgi:hypothetical protein
MSSFFFFVLGVICTFFSFLTLFGYCSPFNVHYTVLGLGLECIVHYSMRLIFSGGMRMYAFLYSLRGWVEGPIATSMVILLGLGFWGRILWKVDKYKIYQVLYMCNVNKCKYKPTPKF